MISRRNFVQTAIKSIAVGSAIIYVPSNLLANELLLWDSLDMPNDEGGFSIEAYNKVYQDTIQQYAFDEATLKNLGLDSINSKESIDMIKRNITKEGKDMIDSLSAAGFQAIKTPPTKYYNKPKDRLSSPTAHKNHGVMVDAIEPNTGKIVLSGGFVGPGKVTKNTEGNLQHEGRANYIIGPAFLQYTQHKDFFCYGSPYTNLVSHKCIDCNEIFYTQDFYYEGDSVYDRKTSRFWQNATSCSVSKNKRDGVNFHRTSDVVFNQEYYSQKFNPIAPCGCGKSYETEKSEKIIKSNH